MSQTVFDERTARQLDAMYRARDIVRRRRLVRDALGAQPGDHVLDVGCGPGYYVAELLEDVGSRGKLVGIDSSTAMLETAARRCAGLGHAEFHHGDATHLPVADQSSDRALCVQVLEFVPDTSAALAEFYRVLRPGGRVVLWDVDWATLSWHSNDPARMQRMLHTWDRHVAHPALPRTLGPALRDAGFEAVNVEGHAFTTAALDPETYGGAALGMVERYLTGLTDIDQSEVRAWADEQRALDQAGNYYYSVVQVCVTGRRSR
jgi:ubiquinone/menaquinone biosynthesis C-methylase UbiE